jgi:glycosyltransferase involved in cell wall biosynthesis
MGRAMSATLPSYVFVTPARNEEAFIGQTIQSVIAQTVLPTKWVIVNDGSTDGTADIVGRYLAEHSWIELVNMPVHRDRSFAAKAHAFNAGYARLRDSKFDVVANLDADITFERDYIEFLLKKFAADPKLGVTGTIFNETGYSSGTNSFEGENHVAGGCQMFRRECFEDVGGYVPTKIGVDWIAVTTARMKGWTTRSYREKAFFHHRSLGTAGRSPLAAMWLYGEKDYRMGWHPLWQLFRVLYRAKSNPLAGLSILGGYVAAFLKRTERPISRELIRFHRGEQMARLGTIMWSLLRLKRVDNFQSSSR